ncbi:hypothetical protein CPC08DRAFT_640730, partial [Agrocybe pediades]
VLFKKVPTSTDEIALATLVSSEHLRKDPRNCAVPILDVILIPGNDDWALLVMPFLMHFHLLPFRRLGEFCEFVLQITKGLEFLHAHNISQGDFCLYNIMMDPTKVVPRGLALTNHPTHDGFELIDFEWVERWSVRPVQYYIIDFGLSSRHQSNDAQVLGKHGQDKTVPKQSDTVPYNPFKLDVYQLGNEYSGLDAFQPLSKSMTQTKPEDRPSAAEAAHLCEEIVLGITKAKRMSSRVWRDTPDSMFRIEPFEKLAVRFLPNYNPRV